MSLKPEVIDALVAAGCTAEQIAAAVKADMASDEQRRNERRTKDRERQRRHRMSRDVTVTGCDSGDKKEAVSPTPPSEEKNIPPSPPKGGSSPKATRLSRDWVLPSEWGEWALGEGLPADRVAFEADKFRDYWHSAGGQRARKVDWFATWRNWIRNVPKGKANEHTAEQTQRDRDSIMRALADELDDGGPSPGSSETGGG